MGRQEVSGHLDRNSSRAERTWVCRMEKGSWEEVEDMVDIFDVRDWIIGLRWS